MNSRNIYQDKDAMTLAWYVPVRTYQQASPRGLQV